MWKCTINSSKERSTSFINASYVLGNSSIFIIFSFFPLWILTVWLYSINQIGAYLHVHSFTLYSYYGGKFSSVFQFMAFEPVRLFSIKSPWQLKTSPNPASSPATDSRGSCWRWSPTNLNDDAWGMQSVNKNKYQPLLSL